VTYDPAKVNYEKLLDVFWHNIDPFDNEGQFCDKGNQYKASIFYLDQQQKQLADAYKINAKEKLLDKNIVTSIMAAGKFYPAEESHQDYYPLNPNKYKFFRFTCGRDRRLEQIWVK
jgi:peptide-methionine (S)-S-oxide reductase